MKLLLTLLARAFKIEFPVQRMIQILPIQLYLDFSTVFHQQLFNLNNSSIFIDQLYNLKTEFRKKFRPAIPPRWLIMFSQSLAEFHVRNKHSTNWLRLDQKAAKLAMNPIGEEGWPENILQTVETLLKIGGKMETVENRELANPLFQTIKIPIQSYSQPDWRNHSSAAHPQVNHSYSLSTTAQYKCMRSSSQSCHHGQSI